MIFDFDGTIANTLESIINIMNNLSSEFGFRKIKDEDIEFLRGKRPKEILRHLGISLFKLPFVIRKARREINSHIATLSPSAEWLPTLRLLKQNGCELGIVTTNIEDNENRVIENCERTAEKIVWGFIYAILTWILIISFIIWMIS